MRRGAAVGHQALGHPCARRVMCARTAAECAHERFIRRISTNQRVDVDRDRGVRGGTGRCSSGGTKRLTHRTRDRLRVGGMHRGAADARADVAVGGCSTAARGRAGRDRAAAASGGHAPWRVLVLVRMQHGDRGHERGGAALWFREAGRGAWCRVMRVRLDRCRVGVGASSTRAARRHLGHACACGRDRARCGIGLRLRNQFHARMDLRRSGCIAAWVLAW